MNWAKDLVLSQQVDRSRFTSELYTEQELARMRVHRELAHQTAIAMAKGEVERFSVAQHNLLSAQNGHRTLQMCPDPEHGDRFFAALQARANANGRGELLLAMSGDDCLMQDTRSQALWAKCGFPYVNIESDEYAASLMTTTVPKDMASVLREPWPAFRIQIPAGLLMLKELDGETLEECQLISVMRDSSSGWTLHLYGSATTLHVTGQDTEHLCEEVDGRLDYVGGAFGMDGPDAKSMRLASRLVLAVCLLFDARQNWPRPEAKRMGGRIAARGNKDPSIRVYKLGRPVSLRCDARPAVRDYVRGTGSVPSTQCYVCGHWKNQRHGPGGGERKFIRIEPYWRGPEDAPIAVRPHVVGAGDRSEAT